MSAFSDIVARADRLKAEGRFEDAVPLYRQAVALADRKPVAEHNLAAALCDAGHYREAAAACRRAMKGGLDAPETWLVLARALTHSDQFDKAEDAYDQVLRRRPGDVTAHYEAAQLVWMMTGEAAAATARLTAALSQAPQEPGLLYALTRVHEHIGDLQAAAHALNRLLALRPNDREPLLVGAYLFARLGDAARGLACAERAYSQFRDAEVLEAYGFACLAAGAARRAADCALAALQAQPNNQNLLSLLATARRALGDPSGG
ncbi:MAG: tetratricopeptide repeat protein, partial [Oceanicaulis sp.]